MDSEKLSTAGVWPMVAIWEIEASQTAAKSASCSSFEVVLRFELELDNICSVVPRYSSE